MQGFFINNSKSLFNYFFLFYYHNNFFKYILQTHKIIQKLHKKLTTTKNHNTQLSNITKHFHQKHIYFYTHTHNTDILIFNHTTTTIKITNNITHIIIQNKHIHFHNKLKQLQTYFQHKLTINTFNHQLKHNNQKINDIITTIIKLNFNIQHKKTNQ